MNRKGSTAGELHQRLNAQRDHETHHHTDEGLPEIAADDLAQVAALAVGEDVLKFLLLDPQGDFPTPDQTQETQVVLSGKVERNAL